MFWPKHFGSTTTIKLYISFDNYQKTTKMIKLINERIYYGFYTTTWFEGTVFFA